MTIVNAKVFFIMYVGHGWMATRGIDKKRPSELREIYMRIHIYLGNFNFEFRFLPFDLL